MRVSWLSLLLLALYVHSGQASQCHGGWYQYGSSCYLFSTGAVVKSWSDARMRCMDQDADLLTIDDTHERDWILSYTNRFKNGRPPVHDYWVGLNALPDGTTWQWPNGTNNITALLNGKWATGQPHRDSGHMCVDIHDNRFTVQPCTTPYRFICERKIGRPLTCDPGWKFDSGMCYLYIGSNTDYNGARTQCRSRGGAMVAQVYDMATQRAVWEQARAVSHSVWLDLKSQQQTNGYQWFWENGTALTKGYWARNPPANLGANVNKTCVEQTLGNVPLQSWNTKLCNARSYVLCQKPQGTCPIGWLQFTNRCFKIYSHLSKSFNGAQNYCNSMGGDLLALDSGDIVFYLWPYVRDARAAGAYTLWIGLTDYNRDNGPWTWLAGNRTNTWTNYPSATIFNTPGKQDCVTIDTTDPRLQFRPIGNCGSPHKFICQMPVNKPLVIPTQPPIHYTCRSGYRLYQPQGTCIQLNQNSKTWSDARADCGKVGADLVTILNADFNNFITSQVQAHIGRYWIGLHDRTNEGHYQWLDNTAVANYTYWHPGQRDNAGQNENCVSIFPQDGFKWWDIPCSTRNNYICQMKATVNGHAPPTTTHRPWSRRCGPFWEEDPNSGSCYIFSTDRLAWQDAKDMCVTTYHGHLASITSVVEQYYINGRISSLGMNFLWVGANDRAQETGWRWEDNSPMAFLNWKAHQPDNQGDADCVAISGTDGQWSDFKCTDRYAYICEKNTVTTRPPQPPTTPAHIPAGKVWGCGRGWRGFNGQCYSFIPQTQVTWPVANRGCGQRGATLVSIHSESENNFVFSLKPSGYRGSIWLGLSDTVMEGSFAWTDMTPVTYTIWKPHEPNNILNEDCVAFYNSKYWNDFKCTTNTVNAFICKKPMDLQDPADIQLGIGCAHGIGYRAQCYAYLSDQANTWTASQSLCRGLGGDLVTVNVKEIQSFLSSELLYRPSPYWIGLHNTGPLNTSYVWSTNYTLDFTYWSANHTGNEVGTCVAMNPGRPAGLWQNYPCSRILPSICELPRVGFTTPPPTPTTTVPVVQCPDTWTAVNSLCIKAFNVSLTNRLSWMGSRDKCRSLGGDLLSVRGKEMETQIINNVFNNVTEGDWWIGLNDRDSENGHVWSDGHGLAYTNWLDGEPNDYNHREDCVAWLFRDQTTNGWMDYNCYVARRYICYIQRGKTIPTTPVPPSVSSNNACPRNGTWFFWNGYCYFISPEMGDNSRLTWYGAQRMCRSLSAQLTSIHTVDENGLLTSVMSRNTHWAFWIGLNDLSQNGYSWTDGTPVDFVSWSVNEPNDAYGGESCVETTSEGSWNDQNCMEQNGYVCKQLPNGMTPPAPTLPDVSGGCPYGFTSAPFLENCYMVSGRGNNSLRNFTEASSYCKNLSPSSTLVSIHNWLEQRYVTTLFATFPHFVWTGLNDIKQRNYFEWQDNTEVRFTHWGPGQPDENLHDNDPSARRDCVAMNPSPSNAGNWNDMTCSTKNHFICQHPRVKGQPTLQPYNTGCPAGYSKQTGNRCYKYYTTPKSWSQSQAVCSGDQATLATPWNRFQRDVVGLIRIPDKQHARNVSDIWIGMTFVGNTFQWTNQWPVRFTSWAQGEPDNTGTCVKMDANFFWHDHPCDSTYPFVCQTGGPTPPPTVATTQGVCKPGWQSQAGYCYKFVYQTQRSWPGARYACQQIGGSLVSIHSKAEMDFLNSLVLTAANKGANPAGTVWIGLSKMASSGFGWSDGTELEFDYWGDGEPSDTDQGQHQDCVQWSMSTGKWNDVDCFNNNYYMCKTPQVSSTTTPKTTSTPQPVVQKSTSSQTTRTQPPTPQKTNQPVTQPPATQPPATQTPASRTNPTNPPVITYTPHNPTIGPGQTVAPNNNMPTKSSQTGSNTGGGGGSGGMSGGTIAAIVLGVLIVVGIAVVAGFMLRNRLPFSAQSHPMSATSSANNGGFENALYTKNGPLREDERGSISFGNDSTES